MEAGTDSACVCACVSDRRVTCLSEMNDHHHELCAPQSTIFSFAPQTIDMMKFRRKCIDSDINAHFFLFRGQVPGLVNDGSPHREFDPSGLRFIERG